MNQSATKKRILIAGIGNIFLGDDGFGVEVVQRLLKRPSRREGVQIVDFGIHGLDLAYTLLGGYDALVLIDAVARGNKPGTLYLIEPDLSAMTPENGAAAARVGLDAHSMDPAKVLAYARTLGVQPIYTLLIGCEPAVIRENEDYIDIQMGLSEAVQAAVGGAIKMVDDLVERLLTDQERN